MYYLIKLFGLIYFLQMKLQVFFEVGEWVELEDYWVFRVSQGHSKVILVKEDISFVDFVDKIYAKLGVSRDMLGISLSYLPQLNGKMSPFFFITANDNVEFLLDSQNEKICKNPLNVTLVPKGLTFNDDIREDNED